MCAGGCDQGQQWGEQERQQVPTGEGQVLVAHTHRNTSCHNRSMGWLSSYLNNFSVLSAWDSTEVI